MLKKTTRKSSVRKGAILRSWLRNQWPADRRGALTSDVEVINASLSRCELSKSSPLRRRPAGVSLLIVSLANSCETDPLRITMIRSASDSTVSGSVEITMTPTP